MKSWQPVRLPLGTLDAIELNALGRLLDLGNLAYLLDHIFASTIPLLLKLVPFALDRA